jgi:hypothetical protein
VPGFTELNARPCQRRFEFRRFRCQLGAIRLQTRLQVPDRGQDQQDQRDAATHEDGDEHQQGQASLDAPPLQPAKGGQCQCRQEERKQDRHQHRRSEVHQQQDQAHQGQAGQRPLDTRGAPAVRHVRSQSGYVLRVLRHLGGHFCFGFQRHAKVPRIELARCGKRVNSLI